MPRHLPALLAALLSCSTADGAMYRWVDENGVTVYSQTARVGGDAVRIDRQAGPTLAEQQAARAHLQEQLEQSQDAAEAKKAAEAEAAAKREEAEQRFTACEAARHNLETLRNLGPRMVRTSDGEYKRMTEDEVAAGIDEASRQIKEYCDP
jgi:hypothetical protein